MDERNVLPNGFKFPEELSTIDSYDKLKRLARILPSYAHIEFEKIFGLQAMQISKYIEALGLTAQLKSSKALITDWQQLLELEQLNPCLLVYLIQNAEFHTIEIEMQNAEHVPIANCFPAVTTFRTASVALQLNCRRTNEDGPISALREGFNSMTSLPDLQNQSDFVLNLLLFYTTQLGAEKPSLVMKWVEKCLPSASVTLEDLFLFDRIMTHMFKNSAFCGGTSVDGYRERLVQALKLLEYPLKLLADVGEQWSNLGDVVAFLERGGDLCLMLLWEKIEPFIDSYETYVQLILMFDIPHSMNMLLNKIKPIDAERVEPTRTGEIVKNINAIFESFSYNNTQRLQCALLMPPTQNQAETGDENYLTIFCHRVMRRQIDGLLETSYLLKELNRILAMPSLTLKPGIRQQVAPMCIALFKLASEQASEFEGQPLLIELRHQLAQWYKLKEICPQAFTELQNTVRANLSLFQLATLSAYKGGILSAQKSAATPDLDTNQRAHSIVEQLNYMADPAL